MRADGVGLYGSIHQRVRVRLVRLVVVANDCDQWQRAGDILNSCRLIHEPWVEPHPIVAIACVIALIVISRVRPPHSRAKAETRLGHVRVLATEHLYTQLRLANRMRRTVALVFLCGRASTTYTGGPNMHMSVTDALRAGAAHSANTRVGIWLSLVAMKIGMNDSHTMHVLHVAGVHGLPHTPARRDEHISCLVESARYLARHERVAEREQQQHERQHERDGHVALFERLAKVVHDVRALVVVDDRHVVGHRPTQQQPHAVQYALRAPHSMNVCAPTWNRTIMDIMANCDSGLMCFTRR